jgi:hypothetical protein
MLLNRASAVVRGGMGPETSLHCKKRFGVIFRDVTYQTLPGR